MKICRENPGLITIVQKYRALYVKTKVRFIAGDHIKSPSQRSLQVRWCQPVRIGKEVQTLCASMLYYTYVAYIVLVCHCLAVGVMCVVE
jgi:hypothetical protein